MAEVLPQIIPAPNAAVKRPAEDTLEAPAMPRAVASRTVASLSPPTKPKKKSQYVRFKALLLKEAKERNDELTVKEITSTAGCAWKMVKDMDASQSVLSESNEGEHNSSSDDNIRRYLRLKAQAVREESDEATKHASALKIFCESFLDAAVAHLRWTTMDATEDNFAALKKAEVDVVVKSTTGGWDQAVERGPLDYALKAAREQLVEFEGGLAEKSLVDKLRGASDQVLRMHAKEHRAALRNAEEIVKLKAQIARYELSKKAEAERKRAEQEKAMSRAHMIKGQVLSALKKQMVYTGSTLRYSSKSISYKRGGVSEAVFAAAFDVPMGTKRTTIEGWEVGTKALRYRGFMSCSTVTVRLVGEELTASTSYSC